MTLIELVVVLLILVAVSTVALQSTERVVSQGRFDATTRQLDSVRFAALGPEVEYDRSGVRLLSGFAVDVGRFPLVNLGGGEGEELSELWQQGGIVTYGTHAANGVNATVAQDSEVELTYGWRGPYLSFPLGTTQQQVLDGWGQGLSYLEPGPNYVSGSPNSTSDGAQAVRVVSRAGLGVLDADPPAPSPDPFERDIPLNFDDYRVTLQVELTVSALDPGDQIFVVLYEASDTNAPSAKVEIVTLAGAPPENQTVSFTGLTPGYKVVRAYRVNSTFSGPTYNFDDSTPGIVKDRSELAPITSRSVYRPQQIIKVGVE